MASRLHDPCLFRTIISRQISDQPASPYAIATQDVGEKTAKYMAVDFVRTTRELALKPSVDAVDAARNALISTELAEKTAKAACDKAIKDSADPISEAAKQKPIVDATSEQVKLRRSELAAAEQKLKDETDALPSEWVAFEQQEPEWPKKDANGYVLSQDRHVVSWDATSRTATVQLWHRHHDRYLKQGATTVTDMAAFIVSEVHGYISPDDVKHYWEVREKKLAEAGIVPPPAPQLSTKPLPQTPAAVKAADLAVKDTVIQ